jgi:hypothetical protein
MSVPFDVLSFSSCGSGLATWRNSCRAGLERAAFRRMSPELLKVICQISSCLAVIALDPRAGLNIRMPHLHSSRIRMISRLAQFSGKPSIIANTPKNRSFCHWSPPATAVNHSAASLENGTSLPSKTGSRDDYPLRTEINREDLRP